MIRRLAAIVVIAASLAAAEPAAGAQQLLPDLAMAKLSTIRLDTTTMPGHRLLRYTAVMVDVGAGPVEVRGTRSSTSGSMKVVQRIYDSAGGHTDVPTSIAMQYAGDGHDHWHSLDMEGGSLARLDNGVKVAALAKHGFCFFDNVAFRLSLAGSPASPFYTSSNSCGFGNPSALNVKMGLSVGWGDMYSSSTNFQWIDITGLPNGKYRLTAKADPLHLVREASYANQGASARIRITSTGVTVLSYGPGA